MSEHQTESWSKPLVNLFRRRALRLPSIGISIGDTVPLWGPFSGRVSGMGNRLFYGWMRRSDEGTCGGFGFKAGFIFVRVSAARRK